MGSIGSRIRGTVMTRPLQRWNVETRAEKVISKEKPVAAPMYPSDEEFLQNLRRTNPNLTELVHKKDPKLHERLKEVSHTYIYNIILYTS